MFQILKQNQTEIMSLRVGSGLPNIQKKDLVAYPLNLPSSIKTFFLSSNVICLLMNCFGRNFAQK